MTLQVDDEVIGIRTPHDKTWCCTEAKGSPRCCKGIRQSSGGMLSIGEKKTAGTVVHEETESVAERGAPSEPMTDDRGRRLHQ
jgi:hypothetical protein